MKRDMDLVRGLLLCVEVDGDLTALYKQYSQEVVIGHLEIMMDANLLVGNVQSYLDGSKSAIVQRLTWAGHEFLDNARNDTV